MLGHPVLPEPVGQTLAGEERHGGSGRGVALHGDSGAWLGHLEAGRTMQGLDE